MRREPRQGHLQCCLRTVDEDNSSFALRLDALFEFEIAPLKNAIAPLHEMNNPILFLVECHLELCRLRASTNLPILPRIDLAPVRGTFVGLVCMQRELTEVGLAFKL